MKKTKVSSDDRAFHSPIISSNAIDKADFPIVKIAGSLLQTMKICNCCIILRISTANLLSDIRILKPRIFQILTRMLFLIWFPNEFGSTIWLLPCWSGWKNVRLDEFHAKNHVFEASSHSIYSTPISIRLVGRCGLNVGIQSIFDEKEKSY